MPSSLRERTEQLDSRYNAFLSYAETEPPVSGPLEGLRLAVKDVLALKGERLTCGSHILENFTSLYTATCVEKLTKAGAVLVGKTNMDEFAMGSSNETSYYGPVKNPWNLECVPGGSSGGSAVAVAIGAADLALGTDTGGSIRQPAAFTGTIGLKPTYGRISRYGLTAFASSFDTVGTFTRSLDHAAAALQVMSGPDSNDMTSVQTPIEHYANALRENVAGLRFGVPSEYFGEGLDSEIRTEVNKATQKLKNLGMKMVEISMPYSKYSIATYYILTTAEASSNLARFDGIRYGRRAEGVKDLEETYIKSRTEGFGTEVKRRIMLGTYVLSHGYYDAYYKRAQKVRRLVKEDFEKAFEKCDVIITPTTPGTAFKFGQKADPLAMYLNDIFTVGANLSGNPAISIPVALSKERLPIGVQLIARSFDESMLFRVGKEIHQDILSELPS